MITTLSLEDPPLVGTWNLRVLGSSEPTLEEPCEGEERGVVWVKPSQLDPQSRGPRIPYRRYCGQHTFLQGPHRAQDAVSTTSFARAALSVSTLSLPPCSSSTNCSPCCGAAMRALHGSGLNTALGVMVPAKPPHRIRRITVCLPPRPRLLANKKIGSCWEMTQEMFPYSAQCLVRR